MPDFQFLAIIGLVVLALAFDYTNGFHDAANSIATVVSTRVLTPRVAVVWAAVFNFIAFLVFETRVADTVGRIVSPSVVSEAVILAGLVGAISWNLLTWWFGLPTSSSHALIGGFAGAGMAKAGLGVINLGDLELTAAFIVVSPAVGLAIAVLIVLAAMWGFRNFSPRPVDRLFRRLQLVSAAAFSLGHGGNDAQKTMGIIAALLVSTGYMDLRSDGSLPVPLWVVLSAHGAIALGTLAGGWRIVRTLGQRITALKPLGGFSAETAAASSLYLATYLGVPVSTTHTITGGVVGAGAARRLSAVRWGVARRVLWAWVLTIPGAALTAAAVFTVVDAGGAVTGGVLAAVLAVAGAVVIRERARQGRAARTRHPDQEGPEAASPSRSTTRAASSK
jgi:PiT family inorganic phosphate transporter